MERLTLSAVALAAAANAACAAFVPLPREEAAKGREVCVTGVVTCVAHWQKNSFIVADPADPNGPALYATGEHPDDKSTHDYFEFDPDVPYTEFFKK